MAKTNSNIKSFSPNWNQSDPISNQKKGLGGEGKKLSQALKKSKSTGLKP